MDQNQIKSRRNLERVQEVVKELLSKYEFLYEKRIQKLVFYGELYCIHNYEKRLTNADFKPYMYGAFSEDIREALNLLADAGEIESETDQVRRSKRYRCYEANSELSPEVKQIIDLIHQKTKEKSTDDLAQVSKQNWLFENTPYDTSMEFKRYLQRLTQDTDLRSDLREETNSVKIGNKEHSHYLNDRLEFEDFSNRAIYRNSLTGLVEV